MVPFNFTEPCQHQQVNTSCFTLPNQDLKPSQYRVGEEPEISEDYTAVLPSSETT